MKLGVVWRGERAGISQVRVEKVINQLIKQQDLTGKVEVSLSLVGDDQMARLNKYYLKKEGTTDVLSFPLKKEKGPDGVMRLGDIVVCLPQARRQAEEKGLRLQEEVEWLTEHGVKHLLGMHHK